MQHFQLEIDLEDKYTDAVADFSNKRGCILTT